MKIFYLLTMFLLFIPSIFAQEVSLGIVGTCKEYNVTISLEGFEIGCYDVKIDITTPAGRVGRIFDPREGWKSSMYYVNEGLCVEGNQTVSKTFQLLAETSANQLNFAGTIRHGSKTWNTGYYDITNNCPETNPQNDIVAIFIAIISIEIILLGFVIWDIIRKSRN